VRLVIDVTNCHPAVARNAMYEYAWHEGNRGLANILRAARLEDGR
jgi:hypothetical protein